MYALWQTEGRHREHQCQRNGRQDQRTGKKINQVIINFVAGFFDQSHQTFGDHEFEKLAKQPGSRDQ